MASIPAVSVSLEEYFNTSYEGAVEYVDGELREKGVTGHGHGLVQGLLFEWFRAHRKEWSISCSVETHTLVASNRVRLPDVVVIRRGTAPKHTIVNAPILAVEVLSPSDRPGELNERAQDLVNMGTADVWLIDPEKRSASTWVAGKWQATSERYLRSSISEAFVDLEWLWTEMDDSQ